MSCEERTSDRAVRTGIHNTKCSWSSVNIICVAAQIVNIVFTVKCGHTRKLLGATIKGRRVGVACTKT